MTVIDVAEARGGAHFQAPLPPGSNRRTGVPHVADERSTDPRWTRYALAGLLVGTALLYLWGLGASGWANTFYSGAVQAGTKSWKAFFFGSSDAANGITVDKPPASLWVMALSARLFGLSSWSILVPQALEGVAAVALLYLTVRRWFGSIAGLLAGAVMALTPAAVLMFRFNNPDALLVLLLTASAYATVRALENGGTRWVVLAGTLVGWAFLAKMLQAFLVVPAIGLVYLVAGPPRLGRRVLQLLAGGLAMFLSAGWWVAIVELTPASSRPYIGGSQNNSLLNLIFGYNGFGRLTGNESGSVGGGPGGPGGAGGRLGGTGITRLFNAEMGGQVSWLLPAALMLLVAGLVVTWRRPRTNRTRAAFMLWGGWLLVTGAVFSFSHGIIHPYYTVALAPAIGALVGMGAVVLWRRRPQHVARTALAATVAVTGVWSFVLLRRTPTWNPVLRYAVLVVGLVAAVVVATAPLAGAWLRRRSLAGRTVPLRKVVGLRNVVGLRKVVGAGAICVGLLAAMAGSGAYTLETASTAHGGAIPSAGPAGQGGFGPGRGFGGAVRPAGGGAPAFGGAPAMDRARRDGQPGRGANGSGGLLDGSSPSAALTTFLERGAQGYTWVAATVRSNQAAGYQLATGDPIMAVGGFNGTDPYPTLAQFQQHVAQGKIHYFIGGGSGPGGFGGGAGAGGPGAGAGSLPAGGPAAGGFGGPAGAGATSPSLSQPARQIEQWVTATFNSTTVGGVAIYDLTSRIAAS